MISASLTHATMQVVVAELKKKLIFPWLFVFALLPLRAFGETTLLREAQANQLYRQYQGQAPSSAEPTETVSVAPSAASRFDSYFVNPFLAFDMGLSSQSHLVPESAYQEVLSWLVHSPGPGEAGTSTQRLKRDGRLAYTGFAPITSYQSPGTALARVEQKGDLETGLYGGHSDGHEDAVDAMQLMVVGELLHRNGIYTARGLFAARLRGIRRKIEHGMPDTAPAGVELRVGGRPRFLDTKTDPYFSVMEKGVPDWSHPLIVSGLETLDPSTRQRRIATLNEGMMKDLWALHGSLNSENRSEATIDLGTFAFLTEPNANAAIPGGTSGYWDEVQTAAKTPDSLFYDSFAFNQLRRLGFPPDIIRQRFFDKVTESHPGGDFVYFRAKPETKAFAETVLSLDLTTPRGNSRFRADEDKKESTEYRSLVNTRKLLRTLLSDPRALYRRSSLSDEEVRDLLRGAYFPEFAHYDPLTDGELSHIRGGKYDEVRKLCAFLHENEQYIDGNREQMLKVASGYPLDQNLPTRTEINRKVERWFDHPFSFQGEFVQWIESLDPPDGRDARKAHYEAARREPVGSALDLFRALLQGLVPGRACSLDWARFSPKS